MERFIIQGGIPLKGTVMPSGNKNAALPILAATLLTDQPVTLHNLPNIGDVRTMITLLENLGAEVQHHGNHTVTDPGLPTCALPVPIPSSLARSGARLPCWAPCWPARGRSR